MSTPGITVLGPLPELQTKQPGAARAAPLAATHNPRGKKTRYDLSPELTTPYAILDVTSQTPTTCRDRFSSPLLGKHWAEAATNCRFKRRGPRQGRCVVGGGRGCELGPSARAAAPRHGVQEAVREYPREVRWIARLGVRRHEQRVNFVVTHRLVAAQVL